MMLSIPNRFSPSLRAQQGVMVGFFATSGSAAPEGAVWDCGPAASLCWLRHGYGVRPSLPPRPLPSTAVLLPQCLAGCWCKGAAIRQGEPKRVGWDLVMGRDVARAGGCTEDGNIPQWPTKCRQCKRW